MHTIPQDEKIPTYVTMLNMTHQIPMSRAPSGKAHFVRRVIFHLSTFISIKLLIKANRGPS